MSDQTPTTDTPSPITPPKDATTNPTCVGIRPSGDVCASPDIKSTKYQLCSTCYTNNSRLKKLATMTVYKKPQYGKRADGSKQVKKPPPVPKTLEPDFSDGELLLAEDDFGDDTSKSFAYGRFDVSGLDRWEKTFVFNRKKDVVEKFDDPSSRGIAHRWVLAELSLEQLRRKAAQYQSTEDFAKLNQVLTQMNKIEKMVQDLQKELSFLPSQTMEDKKIEEVFSNMATSYKKHKAHYVADFDDDEIELMVAKGMDVELERTRITEITGRLAKERARAIHMIIVDSALEVARETFGLDDRQSADYVERMTVRIKSKVPEMIPLVD